MGYKIGDIHGREEDSVFTKTQSTTGNGTRSSTFKAFSEKFVGDKLTLSTYSHVTKILIEKGVAVGVELVRHGVEQKFWCRREVVLSAGAVGSPQLLMLSGVGDRIHLEE